MCFAVTYAAAEDGWIVAEGPALPGCISQGRDEAEARTKIEEAIVAWLWAEKDKPVVARARAML
jgi:predicted RNase H-like HicB family nuclease